MKKLLFLLFFLIGCKDAYRFKTMPEGPINHQLIALARLADSVKARGFKGATPPFTQITLGIGPEIIKIHSAEDGSFHYDFTHISETNAYLAFEVNGKNYEQKYQIKNLNQSINKMTKKAFLLPDEISDFSIRQNNALLLSLSAAKLIKLPIDDHWVIGPNNSHEIPLNEELIEAINPKSVDIDNKNAVITFSTSHEIALVNYSSPKDIFKSKLKDKDGSLFLFDLNPPLIVKEPINASGHSQKSKIITRSFAHNPSQVIALANDLFAVSFTNYYQYFDPEQKTNAVVGPGIIALVAIKDNSLVTKSIAVLPYKNPLFIDKIDQEKLLVTCSGSYYEKDNHLKSDDAGLVILTYNNQDLTISKELPLKNFIPAKPAVIENTIIVPEYYGRRVAVIGSMSNNALENVKEAPGTYPYRFTYASFWHDHIAFLGEYNGLIAFSISEGFFPFPFVLSIPLNKKQKNDIAFMPSKMIFRHHNKGLSLVEEKSPGFNALVLSELQSKIVPIDFFGVLGP